MKNEYKYEYEKDEYEKLSDAKKNKLGHKFKPITLRLKDHNYVGWFIEEKSNDETLENDKNENLLIQQPRQH